MSDDEWRLAAARSCATRWVPGETVDGAPCIALERCWLNEAGEPDDGVPETIVMFDDLALFAAFANDMVNVTKLAWPDAVFGEVRLHVKKEAH